MPPRRRLLSLSLLCLPLIATGFVWAAAAGILFGPRDAVIGPYGFHLSAYRFEAGTARQGELVVTRHASGGGFKGGLVILNAQVINLQELVDTGAAPLVRTVALRATNFISLFLVGDPKVRLSLEVRAAAALPAPTATLTVSPTSVMAGETVVLEWQSAHADTLSIEPGVGAVGPSGSVTVSPTQTTTFILTARGPGGTAEARVTVDVTRPPLVSLSASPSVIPKGGQSILSWSAAGAEAVHIEPGIGVVAAEGTRGIAPVHTTTFRLTATGPGGTASVETVVQVYIDITPQPPGSFGQVYQDLVPPDATVEDYDARRFAIITGLVKSQEGEPLPEVSVTIHGHPEFGTAVTDREGRFSLPVEGGGVLTTLFRKAGYLSSQRQVQTPWNDMAVTETVVMVTEDPAATTIVYNGNPDQVHLHRSTPVSDEFGGRSCTVVFSGDNPPYLVDEKGNAVQPLTTITTRATEFTTPESMPAKLPPNSAYTYCVELSVDGAARVKFGKPVVMWVENFLGFAVGGAVPVGYFDRDRGLWVPADNGRVVGLLDRDGNGVVDALDADGDGQPDDLNANGFFEDEVAGLENPQHYAPGSSFWRVEVSHFTPWDLNWPYGPPLDAGPPNPASPPALDQQQPEEKTCSEEVGSFVEHRSRIFHEDIPIPGTGMSLHYASNRVSGYRHLISVPASGPSVPPSLKQILVKMEIAGRSFEAALDPLPNQKAEFWWDGRDNLGRQVSGSITAKINIGFVYPAVYLSPGNFSRAFAQAGESVTGISARQEVISWSRSDLVVRSTGVIGTIAEGWTLSHHHQIDLPDLNTVHRGDGFSAQAKGRTLNTIAGTGEAGFSGDGGPAIQARLRSPWQLTIHPSGDLYFADYGNGRIRKIDRDGIITTVAGGGSNSYGSGPSLEASISPTKAIFDLAGNMLIADRGGKIWKVDNNGKIVIVASGLGFPTESVAVDPSGNIYAADESPFYPWRRRIQKIDPSGMINTIAILPLPHHADDIALDSAGNLYVADGWNSIVIKIDTSGRMTVVAGTGSIGNHGRRGYSGDGGPGTKALLNHPNGIAIDKEGNIFIADQYNSRVRKLDNRGIITTVAGNGTYAVGVDGQPATNSSFGSPMGVAVGSDGSLYVSEFLSSQFREEYRIRKISHTAVYIAALESGEILFAEESGLGHIFSSEGRHLKTVDLETTVALYSIDYDAEGRLTAATDRFGNRTFIERDGGGRAVGIVSPDGLRTALAVDGQNHLNQIRYSDGASYFFDYTAEGLLTAKNEPKGNRFDHVYDDAGRLEYTADEEQGLWQFGRDVDIAGHIMSNVFSAEGEAITYQDRTDSTGAYTSRITDAQGEETLFSSSADGLATRKTLPCGTVLDFLHGTDAQYLFRALKKAAETTPASLKRESLFDKTYQDTNGDKRPDRITETVSVNGKAFTRLNDTLQARLQITTPLGRTTLLSYDPENLLVSRIGRPGLYDTQFAYDARGRLVASIIADRQALFSYDAVGNLATFTDPSGRATAYEHDALGRPIAIRQPDGSVVGFGYDANGNMTLLVNPAEVSHEFGLNRVNLQSSYRTPLSGSYQYRYNRDRRPLETLFPSGKVILHTYDKGLLSRTTTPEGEINFGYLCGGRIGTISARGEGLSYTYDGSLLTSESLSGSLNQVLSFRYNNDFQPVEAAYAGASTGYGYDADGLLIQAGGYSIARHAGNGLPLEVSGQGFVMNRAFNGYGELSGQSVSVGGRDPSAFNLARDASGRITRRSEAFGGAAAAYDYFYDANGRLTKVLKEGLPAEEYAYDETGTRIYEKNTRRGIAGRSFEYSDEDHLLKAGEWARRVFNQQNQSNQFNQSNPICLFQPRGAFDRPPAGGEAHRLRARSPGPANRKARQRGRDGEIPLAGDDAAFGGLQQFRCTPDALRVRRRPPAGSDDGSLRLVVNGAGSVVKSIQYDSFGNILEETNPAFTIPLGFAGGLHDPDTGLLRFGYRDYDPDVGRWTAKDPIGFAGGDTDLYGYVLNDPINFIDPRGLWGIKYGGSLIGIDFSAALYDSDKGWFPNATTDIGVSTTAFGGGIQITFDTGVESRSNPCEDVNVSMGMGKYLGVTYNTELSRGSVNLGLGLGLPLTLSTPIKNFTQGLSNSLQRVFH